MSEPPDEALVREELAMIPIFRLIYADFWRRVFYVEIRERIRDEVEAVVLPHPVAKALIRVLVKVDRVVRARVPFLFTSHPEIGYDGSPWVTHTPRSRDPRFGKRAGKRTYKKVTFESSVKARKRGPISGPAMPAGFWHNSAVVVYPQMFGGRFDVFIVKFIIWAWRKLYAALVGYIGWCFDVCNRLSQGYSAIIHPRIRYPLEIVASFVFQVLYVLGLFVRDIGEFFKVPDDEEQQLRNRAMRSDKADTTYPSMLDMLDLYTPFLRTGYALKQLVVQRLDELRLYHLFGERGRPQQRMYPVVPLVTFVKNWTPRLQTYWSQVCSPFIRWQARLRIISRCVVGLFEHSRRLVLSMFGCISTSQLPPLIVITFVYMLWLMLFWVRVGIFVCFRICRVLCFGGLAERLNNIRQHRIGNFFVQRLGYRARLRSVNSQGRLGGGFHLRCVGPSKWSTNSVVVAVRGRVVYSADSLFRPQRSILPARVSFSLSSRSRVYSGGWFRMIVPLSIYKYLSATRIALFKQMYLRRKLSCVGVSVTKPPVLWSSSRYTSQARSDYARKLRSMMFMSAMSWHNLSGFYPDSFTRPVGRGDWYVIRRSGVASLQDRYSPLPHAAIAVDAVGEQVDTTTRTLLASLYVELCIFIKDWIDGALGTPHRLSTKPRGGLLRKAAIGRVWLSPPRLGRGTHQYFSTLTGKFHTNPISIKTSVYNPPDEYAQIRNFLDVLVDVCPSLMFFIERFHTDVFVNRWINTAVKQAADPNQKIRYKQAYKTFVFLAWHFWFRGSKLPDVYRFRIWGSPGSTQTRTPEDFISEWFRNQVGIKPPKKTRNTIAPTRWLHSITKKRQHGRPIGVVVRQPLPRFADFLSASKSLKQGTHRAVFIPGFGVLKKRSSRSIVVGFRGVRPNNAAPVLKAMTFRRPTPLGALALKFMAKVLMVYPWPRMFGRRPFEARLGHYVSTFSVARYHRQMARLGSVLYRYLTSVYYTGRQLLKRADAEKMPTVAPVNLRRLRKLRAPQINTKGHFSDVKTTKTYIRNVFERGWVFGFPRIWNDRPEVITRKQLSVLPFRRYQTPTPVVVRQSSLLPGCGGAMVTKEKMTWTALSYLSLLVRQLAKSFTYEGTRFPRGIFLFYEVAMYRVSYNDKTRVVDVYFRSIILTTIIRFFVGTFWIIWDAIRDYCRILYYFNSKRDFLRRGVDEKNRCIISELYVDAPNFSWDRIIQTLVARRRTHPHLDKATRRKKRGWIVKHTYKRRGIFVVRYFRHILRFFARRYNPLYINVASALINGFFITPRIYLTMYRYDLAVPLYKMMHRFWTTKLRVRKHINPHRVREVFGINYMYHVQIRWTIFWVKIYMWCLTRTVYYTRWFKDHVFWSYVYPSNFKYWWRLVGSLFVIYLYHDWVYISLVWIALAFFHFNFWREQHLRWNSNWLKGFGRQQKHRQFDRKVIRATIRYYIFTSRAARWLDFFLIHCVEWMWWFYLFPVFNNWTICWAIIYGYVVNGLIYYIPYTPMMGRIKKFKRWLRINLKVNRRRTPYRWRAFKIKCNDYIQSGDLEVMIATKEMERDTVLRYFRDIHYALLVWGKMATIRWLRSVMVYRQVYWFVLWLLGFGLYSVTGGIFWYWVCTCIGIFLHWLDACFNFFSRLNLWLEKAGRILCIVIFFRYPFIDVVASMPFWIYFGIISWSTSSLWCFAYGSFPYFSVVYLLFLYSLFIFGSLALVRRVLYFIYNTTLNTLIFLHHFIERNDNLMVGDYELTYRVRNFICVVYSITVYVVFMLPQLNEMAAAIPFFIVFIYTCGAAIMRRVYHVAGIATVVYADSQLQWFLFLNAFVRVWEYSYAVGVATVEVLWGISLWFWRLVCRLGWRYGEPVFNFWVVVHCNIAVIGFIFCLFVLPYISM